MTAKEWLSRGWQLNREIEAMERAEEKMFAHYTRITPQYSAEPGGGTANPHKLDGYAEFREKLETHIRELSGVSAEIFGVICRVNDSRLRTLLLHRYLSFMTWTQIAEAMGYDVRHVTRLHGEALEAAKYVLECP